jgi:hypothetical protein
MKKELSISSLRYGNLFINEEGDILEVLTIDTEGVNGFHDESEGGMNYENGGLYEQISGIPLTEEWLLRFGFEKHKKFDCYENVYHLEGFYVSLGEYDNIFSDVWDDDNGNPINIKCYEQIYIHQLQNLYFAMTEKELVLKLETKP